MADRRTRIKETREDVYRDSIVGELNDVGLGFQEFNDRVEEQRERMGGLNDEIGHGLAVLEQAEPRDRDFRRVETDSDDLFNARRVHEERSELAQARDRATTADRVTGDFDQWAEAPNLFDFPGIDTEDDVQPTF